MLSSSLPDHIFIYLLKFVTLVLGAYLGYVAYKMFQIEKAVASATELKEELRKVVQTNENK